MAAVGIGAQEQHDLDRVACVLHRLPQLARGQFLGAQRLGRQEMEGRGQRRGIPGRLPAPRLGQNPDPHLTKQLLERQAHDRHFRHQGAGEGAVAVLPVKRHRAGRQLVAPLHPEHAVQYAAQVVQAQCGGGDEGQNGDPERRYHATREGAEDRSIGVVGGDGPQAQHEKQADGQQPPGHAREDGGTAGLVGHGVYWTFGARGGGWS